MDNDFEINPEFDPNVCVETLEIISIYNLFKRQYLCVIIIFLVSVIACKKT